MMGAGKSRGRPGPGRAPRRRFVDSDAEIERARRHEPCAEIFGARARRASGARERAVIEALARARGGRRARRRAPSRSPACRALGARAAVVWLRAAPRPWPRGWARATGGRCCAGSSAAERAARLASCSPRASPATHRAGSSSTPTSCDVEQVAARWQRAGPRRRGRRAGVDAARCAGCGSSSASAATRSRSAAASCPGLGVAVAGARRVARRSSSACPPVGRRYGAPCCARCAAAGLAARRLLEVPDGDRSKSLRQVATALRRASSTRAPTAARWWWRSAAAWSATSPASWRRRCCAGSPSCRCRRRCSRWSTPASAARSA